MRKPENLLEFKPWSGAIVGYAYIDSDYDAGEYYDSFRVKIKTNQSPEWEEVQVKSVERYRGAQGTMITLASNESNKNNYQGIHVPDGMRMPSGSYVKPTVRINNEVWDAERLPTENIKFDDNGCPILDPLPIMQVSESSGAKHYDFNDLLSAIRNILEPYQVTTKGINIFEHTLLRLANISFWFDNFFQFERSRNQPNWFFMDLGISEKDAIKFRDYFNKMYGENTAVYTPEFNDFNKEFNHYTGLDCVARTSAIRFNLTTMIEKVLPDFEKKVMEILADPNIQKSYSMPFDQLDEETRAWARAWSTHHEFDSFNSSNSSPRDMFFPAAGAKKEDDLLMPDIVEKEEKTSLPPSI